MGGARKSPGPRATSRRITGPRQPTGDELDLFARVTRDATRFTSRRYVEDAPPPQEASEPAPPAGQPATPEETVKQQGGRRPESVSPPPVAPTGPAALAEHRQGAAPGLDRRLQMRLKRGQLPIEARIDLHGMTRKTAHVALNGFLHRQQALGRRCVLVITGKGRPERGGEWRDSGVIRRALPGWLRGDPNASRVLAFASAQPRHGGHGACYVLLRRERSAAQP